MPEPLVDPELADQFFSATSPDEIAEVRSMVAEFEESLAPRLAELRSLCASTGESAAAARRNVHGLRGVVANFALARAAGRLSKLENEWNTLTAGERNHALSEIESDVLAGLETLREHYPHLK